MRQEYEIVIEDKNGIWKNLDLGNDRLAWNCMVNDIAVLENRNASFSIGLKLPKSTNNANIFEYANVFDAVTDIPYKRHNCRIFCAGRAIAGKGSFLELIRIRDYFECVILSGTANFFASLKEAKFSDIDLGIFQICNASMNPNKWHPSYKIAFGLDIVHRTYPFPFPFNTPNAAISNYPCHWIKGVGAKYPVVSIDYILSKIISQNGYTFESNIDYYKNKYISINSADVEPSPEDKKVFRMIAKTTDYVPSQGTMQYNWNIIEDRDGLSYLSQTSGGPSVAYSFQFIGTVRIEAEYTVTAGHLYIVINGELVDTWPSVNNPGGIFSKFSEVYEIKRVPSTIRIYARADSDQVHSATTFTVTITPVNILPSNAGGILKLNERLGFDTQFDFMKFFAQTFGLTFIIDERKKHVFAFTFHHLYDNIKAGKVKDWSGKLDRRHSAFSFSLNKYGQENTISFEDNSKDEITDSGVFRVTNETLNKTKELFKIGLHSGQDIRMTNGIAYSGTGPQIPLVELKSPDWVDIENPNEDDEMDLLIPEYWLFNAGFPSIKPHLVELSSETVSVPVRITGQLRYDYQKAKYVSAQQLVDMGYKILQDKMLKRAKIIEADFYLTPEDVEMFEPSMPVWIEHYGAYFYLNKIKNFVSGKLTTCELIRL